VLATLDNADCERRQERASEETTIPPAWKSDIERPMARAWKRAVARELRRGPDGRPHRRKRLQCLGNMQVPRLVRAAWELLTE
jgi:hypothetical protein